jgi:protein-S-isoprenylcysteine O-methyltransferase Ste14
MANNKKGQHMKDLNFTSLIKKLTHPEVVPGLRGIVMVLIIFKVATAQAVKGGGSTFAVVLDYLASVGFLLAVLLLVLLLWSKYTGFGKKE